MTSHGSCSSSSYSSWSLVIIDEFMDKKIENYKQYTLIFHLSTHFELEPLVCT